KELVSRLEQLVAPSFEYKKGYDMMVNFEFKESIKKADKIQKADSAIQNYIQNYIQNKEKEAVINEYVTVVSNRVLDHLYNQVLIGSKSDAAMKIERPGVWTIAKTKSLLVDTTELVGKIGNNNIVMWLDHTIAESMESNFGPWLENYTDKKNFTVSISRDYITDARKSGEYLKNFKIDPNIQIAAKRALAKWITKNLVYGISKREHIVDLVYKKQLVRFQNLSSSLILAKEKYQQLPENTSKKDRLAAIRKVVGICKAMNSIIDYIVKIKEGSGMGEAVAIYNGNVIPALQEFTQYEKALIAELTISERAKNCPIGLENNGPFCYANSLLQLFYHIPEFRNGIIKMDTSKFVDIKNMTALVKLREVFIKMQNNKPTSASEVISALPWSPEEKADAHDVFDFSRMFLRLIYSQLHQQRQKDITDFLDNFFGKEQTTIAANDGVSKESSVLASSMQDVTLSIKNSNSLDKCFKNFTQPTNMQDGYAFDFTNPKPAIETKQFVSLPNLLQVRLDRFKRKDGIETERDETSVNIPLTLDLKNSRTADSQDEDTKYQLYGAIFHSGTATSGHYFTELLIDGKWYGFNDGYAYEIENPTINNPSNSPGYDVPYMLLYVKQNKVKQFFGDRAPVFILPDPQEKDNSSSSSSSGKKGKKATPPGDKKAGSGDKKLESKPELLKIPTTPLASNPQQEVIINGVKNQLLTDAITKTNYDFVRGILPASFYSPNADAQLAEARKIIFDNKNQTSILSAIEKITTNFNNIIELQCKHMVNNKIDKQKMEMGNMQNLLDGIKISNNDKENRILTFYVLLTVRIAAEERFQYYRSRFGYDFNNEAIWAGYRFFINYMKKDSAEEYYFSVYEKLLVGVKGKLASQHSHRVNNIGRKIDEIENNIAKNYKNEIQTQQLQKFEASVTELEKIVELMHERSKVLSNNQDRYDINYLVRSANIVIHFCNVFDRKEGQLAVLDAAVNSVLVHDTGIDKQTKDYVREKSAKVKDKITQLVEFLKRNDKDGVFVKFDNYYNSKCLELLEWPHLQKEYFANGKATDGSNLEDKRTSLDKRQKLTDSERSAYAKYARKNYYKMTSTLLLDPRSSRPVGVNNLYARFNDGGVYRPPSKYKPLKHGTLPGLQNYSSSCYSNAYLHQLYNIPKIRDMIINNPSKSLFSTELKKLFTKMYGKDASATSYSFASATYNEKRMLKQENLHMQEDVDEFIAFVFDLADEFKSEDEIAKYFCSNFGIKIKDIVTPENTTERGKLINERDDISGGLLRLHIPPNSSDKKITIQDCLEYEVDWKPIGGKVKFNGSEESKSALSRNVIMNNPPLVQIEILRASVDELAKRVNTSDVATKIYDFVKAPETINLAKYIDAKSVKGNCNYKLRGSIVHSGMDAKTGHYVTETMKIVNGKPTWFLIDNEEVLEITDNGKPAHKDDESTNGTLYTLLYCRTDCEEEFFGDTNNTAKTPVDKKIESYIDKQAEFIQLELPLTLTNPNKYENIQAFALVERDIKNTNIKKFPKYYEMSRFFPHPPLSTSDYKNHDLHLSSANNLDELVSYHNNPVLGERLIALSTLLYNRFKTNEELLEYFGKDNVDRLHSSVSSFSQLSNANTIFGKILLSLFNGQVFDGKTIVHHAAKPTVKPTAKPTDDKVNPIHVTNPVTTPPQSVISKFRGINAKQNEKINPADTNSGTIVKAVAEAVVHKTPHSQSLTWRATVDKACDLLFPQIKKAHSPNSNTIYLDNLSEVQYYLDYELLDSVKKQSLGHKLLVFLNAINRGYTPKDFQSFFRENVNKIHSSVTLFLQTSNPDPIFSTILNKYFNGILHKETMKQVSYQKRDYDLQKFIAAQNSNGMYVQALHEISNNTKKIKHWMWYIFPQMQLGSSSISVKYSISNIEEARAYLANKELKERLLKATKALCERFQDAKSLEKFFGKLDFQKFHSSMTLFSRAAEGIDAELFNEPLRKYFRSEYCSGTIKLLSGRSETELIRKEELAVPPPPEAFKMLETDTICISNENTIDVRNGELLKHYVVEKTTQINNAIANAITTNARNGYEPQKMQLVKIDISNIPTVVKLDDNVSFSKTVENTINYYIKIFYDNLKLHFPILIETPRVKPSTIIKGKSILTELVINKIRENRKSIDQNIMQDAAAYKKFWPDVSYEFVEKYDGDKALEFNKDVNAISNARTPLPSQEDLSSYANDRIVEILAMAKNQQESEGSKFTTFGFTNKNMSEKNKTIFTVWGEYIDYVMGLHLGRNYTYLFQALKMRFSVFTDNAFEDIIDVDSRNYINTLVLRGVKKYELEEKLQEIVRKNKGFCSLVPTNQNYRTALTKYVNLQWTNIISCVHRRTSEKSIVETRPSGSVQFSEDIKKYVDYSIMRAIYENIVKTNANAKKQLPHWLITGSSEYATTNYMLVSKIFAAKSKITIVEPLPVDIAKLCENILTNWKADEERLKQLDSAPLNPVLFDLANGLPQAGTPHAEVMYGYIDDVLTELLNYCKEPITTPTVAESPLQIDVCMEDFSSERSNIGQFFDEYSLLSLKKAIIVAMERNVTSVINDARDIKVKVKGNTNTIATVNLISSKVASAYFHREGSPAYDMMNSKLKNMGTIKKYVQKKWYELCNQTTELPVYVKVKSPESVSSSISGAEVIADKIESDSFGAAQEVLLKTGFSI
ncbi:MAG: DUF1810 family protein, partial [Christensenellaceae bacterium]|nr:DUF1810 family protein [Christensenellaceae bacterium]